MFLSIQVNYKLRGGRGDCALCVCYVMSCAHITGKMLAILLEFNNKCINKCITMKMIIGCSLPGHGKPGLSQWCVGSEIP